ncbi:MAG: DUF262 domain-containing protein [Ignavibacteriae bacterium]|nr:DUF262 domain-containing protein [Ignavibacteriota bacterium]
MGDTFNPKSLTIEQLFGNTDALYQIPRYQRPYKWADDQIDKLWDDIKTSYDNNDSDYFLGSIITAKAENDGIYFDVIDGQQRLTTLMILFCILRDNYPEINNGLTDDSLIVVDKSVLESSIILNGKSNRLKLHMQANHQSDFEDLIVNNGSTINLEKPTKKQINSDEEPQFKFINTALFFKSKLAEIGLTEAGKLINYLFQKVKIIRIDCTSKVFAIKLFQVLNDRGLDLTAADLIKSFLLEKISQNNRNDEENLKKKEEQFISDWREIEQNIKNIDINMNDMFIIYEYYLLGSNPAKSLYEELKNIFGKDDPIDIIKDFKDFVNLYYTEIFMKEDKDLYSLRYLRWNFYWKSILMSAYKMKFTAIPELIILMRRYYYLYWIAGKTLTSIKQTSFNIIKYIKEQKSLKFIEEELNNKLRADRIFDSVLNNLTDDDIYSTAWCKPLFLLIEYNSTDNCKPTFIEMNRDLHIEHVLPIKYRNIKEWNHITNSIADKWLNSGGNLTLLSGTKNIKASYNPFHMKMEAYKGKGLDYKNDKITAFIITQRIVEDYTCDKYNKEWNLNSMQDRWEWFCKEIEDILDIDTSAIQNRVY